MWLTTLNIGIGDKYIVQPSYQFLADNDFSHGDEVTFYCRYYYYYYYYYLVCFMFFLHYWYFLFFPFWFSHSQGDPRKNIQLPSFFLCALFYACLLLLWLLLFWWKVQAIWEVLHLQISCYSAMDLSILFSCYSALCWIFCFW